MSIMFLRFQVEELLREFDNVCTLRVRMPISSDLTNPRNFITKISRYDKVVDIPNSMTILDERWPRETSGGYGTSPTREW